MKWTVPYGATPLHDHELQGLKMKHVSTKSQLDHLEQANIQKGMQWMKRQKNRDFLQEDFILESHRRLFGDVWAWAGTFRKSEKNIGVMPYCIAMELRMLLDDIRYWIDNETFDKMEIGIRFHHRLVWIHPFANGNGRHARITADGLMHHLFKENVYSSIERSR
jgi:Fic-DOC domain mobile mystery protein B